MSAGSHCVLLVSGLHRHPIWGDDVNEFKPERWLDPEAMVDPNSALNTAFGKSYAMMLMKTILAHVLRHYRVSSDVTKLKLRIAGLLKPQSGHLISVERRN
ncbi:Cytochrome P450, family 4, subfamily V, polypeptide 2, partial [Operophtera brumata]